MCRDMQCWAGWQQRQFAVLDDLTCDLRPDVRPTTYDLTDDLHPTTCDQRSASNNLRPTT
eukprot:gene10122-2288_t